MANLITISRVIMAFVAIGLLFVSQRYAPISFILTIIVMWFDGLDGYVARKLNETSKLGALLDIMGDRIVENIYWIAFAILGWIMPIIPFIVVTSGIITDAIRSLAFAQGFTAFGEKTMMQGKIEKFIVASNAMRFGYAVMKAAAFLFLIAGNLPYKYQYREEFYMIGVFCSVITVVLCVIRGIPVVFESRRFLVTKDEQ